MTEIPARPNSPEMVAEQVQRQEQFTRVYQRELRYVWKVLARLGAPAAFREDLVHDVFTTAYRQWPTYDARRAVRPWLFGIAFRLFLDFVRKKQNHREEPVAEPEAVDARKSAEEMVAEAEGLRIAETVLQSLELDRRAVFLLHEIDEVPIPEVAETLGIPPNTAYSRLRLARRDFDAKVAEIQGHGGRP